MNEKTTQRPWKSAFREARGVLLAGIFIAVAFNLFASTSVPWIRALPALPSASDSALLEEDTVSAVLTPATAGTVAGIDTGAGGALVDTATMAEAAAEKKRVEDSIQAVKKALADSMKQAKAQEAKAVAAIDAMAAGSVMEITTTQAKMLFDRKRGFWIDARPVDNFNQGHIPGSINIPPNELTRRMNDLPIQNMNGLIVVYCNGGACELSHELAGQLSGIGFKKVAVYTGGFDEWNGAQYPVTKGN